ncbi:hypothetical protein [Halioxenophilus sp. WMMB6]|uniref:hypothetical protein n=1 Tax=Halioxenophilus sp. WMMB6 TaxID=3073815 RepID=UPI00295E6C8D|nr:hypothetical protein [Halioxenophilus sp. WMMB6]
MTDTEHLTNTIRALCAKGYQQYDSGQFEQALRQFYQAWLALPKPQNQYPQAGWVLAAIGDCYFRMAKLPQALEALESCLHCPDMNDNPFVRLRLGQTLLESEQLLEARKQLLKAYQIGGRELFAKEYPKYLACIEDLVV